MGLFSKPKAPDTSKQEEQLKRQEKEAEARRLEEEAKLDREQSARGRRNRGRLSLIATSETGVSDTTG